MPKREGVNPKTSNTTNIQHRHRSLSKTSKHDMYEQLITDFKRTLLTHFACQGINPPCMTTYAPAGKLIHFRLTN